MGSVRFRVQIYLGVSVSIHTVKAVVAGRTSARGIQQICTVKPIRRTILHDMVVGIIQYVDDLKPVVRTYQNIVKDVGLGGYSCSGAKRRPIPSVLNGGLGFINQVTNQLRV
jgi:hypothetical protein